MQLKDRKIQKISNNLNDLVSDTEARIQNKKDQIKKAKSEGWLNQEVESQLEWYILGLKEQLSGIEAIRNDLDNIIN